MNDKAELIRMARETGATAYTNRHYQDRPFHVFSPEQLEAFAAAILRKQAEREPICRLDGRCQYAIDSGAEGMGHCPAGKCVHPTLHQHQRSE